MSLLERHLTPLSTNQSAPDPLLNIRFRMVSRVRCAAPFPFCFLLLPSFFEIDFYIIFLTPLSSLKRCSSNMARKKNHTFSQITGSGAVFSINVNDVDLWTGGARFWWREILVFRVFLVHACLDERHFHLAFNVWLLGSSSQTVHLLYQPESYKCEMEAKNVCTRPLTLISRLLSLHVLVNDDWWRRTMQHQAFKTDVGFFKNRNDYTGISGRSILSSFVCSAIILLFLLDNDYTSWLIVGE